jgi:hypothetical protein
MFFSYVSRTFQSQSRAEYQFFAGNASKQIGTDTAGSFAVGASVCVATQKTSPQYRAT